VVAHFEQLQYQMVPIVDTHHEIDDIDVVGLMKAMNGGGDDNNIRVSRVQLVHVCMLQIALTSPSRLLTARWARRRKLVKWSTLTLFRIDSLIMLIMISNECEDSSLAQTVGQLMMISLLTMKLSMTCNMHSPSIMVV
jgi:hypothetical protein